MYSYQLDDYVKKIHYDYGITISSVRPLLFLTYLGETIATIDYYEFVLHESEMAHTLIKLVVDHQKLIMGR